jgi:hypothetical protein
MYKKLSKQRLAEMIVERDKRIKKQEKRLN